MFHRIDVAINLIPCNAIALSTKSKTTEYIYYLRFESTRLCSDRLLRQRITEKKTAAEENENFFFHHLASSDNQINHIIIMYIEQQWNATPYHRPWSALGMYSEFNGRYSCSEAQEQSERNKNKKKKLNARFFDYSNAFTLFESRHIFHGEQLRIHKLAERAGEMENSKLVSVFQWHSLSVRKRDSFQFQEMQKISYSFRQKCLIGINGNNFEVSAPFVSKSR